MIVVGINGHLMNAVCLARHPDKLYAHPKVLAGSLDAAAKTARFAVGCQGRDRGW